MIAAVVLAAGLSRRMGRPKLTLPWGSTTVIGQVVSVLSQSGLDQILVVTGGAHDQIALALAGQPAELVFNPQYDLDDMAVSLQVGLAALDPPPDAVLVVLGDQPQIKIEVVRRLVEIYAESSCRLVIPSYQMRRGHPWLIDRSLFAEVLSIKLPETMRAFLHRNRDQIEYLEVDDNSVLRDLDTPEDYDRERPSNLKA